MRTLYLECKAGASGDMVLGALADLLDDPSEFKTMIDSLHIPGIEVIIEAGQSKNIGGTHVHISVNGVEEGHEHGHYHAHSKLSDVLGLIGGLDISDEVRDNAIGIYKIIAEAESKVHGVPVDLVHFHEVGALDAVADIVGTCMLIEKLAPETIIASPIRTGYGNICCAHGILPIPAPATANILKGVPVYAGDEEGEFCTPTGAAIIKHFADKFQHMPAMTYDRLGCGIGNKEFQVANILRAYLGDTENVLPVIKEINCNIDDMSPEDIGGVIELLLSENALDAFIKPCIMKKSRPGYELTCLCREKDLEDLSLTILAHTSTIGLRIHDCERYSMSSHFEKCSTEFGEIRIKVSEGFGLSKWKPEYEDIIKAANENGVTIAEIRNSIRYDPDA